MHRPRHCLVQERLKTLQQVTTSTINKVNLSKNEIICVNVSRRETDVVIVCSFEFINMYMLFLLLFYL